MSPPTGMDDASTTVSALKAAVLAFSRERDWEQFHHPKDLGVALACEVGELLEHFRYRTDAQVRDVLAREPDRTAVAHELADCLWLILRLADVCGIDLASSLESKLAEAAARYPADLVRGKPHKYTAYRPPAPDAASPRHDPAPPRQTGEPRG